MIVSWLIPFLIGAFMEFIASRILGLLPPTAGTLHIKTSGYGDLIYISMEDPSKFSRNRKVVLTVDRGEITNEEHEKYLLKEEK